MKKDTTRCSIFFSPRGRSSDHGTGVWPAFQLLCATLLSAQCTDRRVNAITPALFARFPDARAMAQASVEAVYELVRSVSYPNAKARHLVEMARMLTDQYGGEAPRRPPSW